MKLVLTTVVSVISVIAFSYFVPTQRSIQDDLDGIDLNESKMDYCKNICDDHCNMTECIEMMTEYFTQGLEISPLSIISKKPPFDVNKLRAEVYLQDEPVLQGSYAELKESLVQYKDNYTKLIMLVHGLRSFPLDLYLIKDTILNLTNEKVLIIMPNYNPYVNKTSNYFGFVKHIDTHVDLIIENLIQPIYNETKQIFMIGHSLGGQTVGLLGNKMQNIGMRKPDHLIALDGAGPIFTLLRKAFRINDKSGKKVTFIHTSVYLGIAQRSGLVDIYVNSIYKPFKECTKDNFLLVCNHNKAIDFFSEFLKDANTIHSLDREFETRSTGWKFITNAGGGAYRTHKKRGDYGNTYKPNV